MTASAAPPAPGHAIDDILTLPAGKRIEPLVAHAQELVQQSRRDAHEVEATVNGLVELIRTCAGDSHQRLAIGEVLGLLGDPRLRVPEDPAYWAVIDGPHGPFRVGKYPVTTAEFRAWIASGGYDRDQDWSAGGLAWRDSGAKRWNVLADDPEAAPLVIPNQPVVGVTWWEAEAFAHSKGARLLTLEERRFVVRGPEKRPYPWGEPFGSGNSNTREEVLGKPCAVGIFYSDRTPDGVWDLAGNVAEWCHDGGPDSKVIHPGSWQQPSMASWAKALEMIPPDTRSADLGFRLAKDD